MSFDSDPNITAKADFRIQLTTVGSSSSTDGKEGGNNVSRKQDKRNWCGSMRPAAPAR